MTQQELELLETMNRSMGTINETCTALHDICQALIVRITRLEETVGLEREWKR